MTRSEINAILGEADAFIRGFGYTLPPFAYWSPDQMRAAIAAGSDHAARGLGWDITDYGQGRFDELGLFLFTVRNGDAADLARGRGMLYAEKIMISRKGQLSPMHRHTIKAEDIINRGGGTLVLELFAPAAEGGIDPAAEVAVPVDGILRHLPAGGPRAPMCCSARSRPSTTTAPTTCSATGSAASRWWKRMSPPATFWSPTIPEAPASPGTPRGKAPARTSA